MATNKLRQFIQFLKEDLAISESSMMMALKQVHNNPDNLPMILWRYGLVTIEQLDRIYDWLEAA